MNHILIVDDEAEIRESLGEILKEDGYAVTSTATASEAMVLLRDASYDVMLLDIWLPDRDGLEVLTEVRSLGEREHARSHHHLRAWHDRDSGARYQVGCVRFSGEAPFDRPYVDSS